MEIPVWIIALLVGYLLGSIPTGLLIARWVKRVDVRLVGSGRTGGTNVLRAAGWQAGLGVAILDGVKALLSVLLARWLGGSPLLQALVGVAAVVGHNYSIFLLFRGGAGTAASIGGAVGLWPWSGVFSISAGLAAVVFTRRASLGSIVVAIAILAVFVVRAALGAGPWEHVIHGVLTSVLTLWALRPNIRRLFRGEERVISIDTDQRE